MKEFLGENIKLRKTVESDLDYIVSAESDHDTEKYIMGWSKEEHLASIYDPDILHLIVESNIAMRKQGFIILAGLENESQVIEFKRIVISEKSRGTGRESIRLIKKIVFEKLKAKRLWLDVIDYNHRARKLYLSEGFIEEKIKENVDLRGKTVTLIIMVMTKDEYKN